MRFTARKKLLAAAAAGMLAVGVAGAALAQDSGSEGRSPASAMEEGRQPGHRLGVAIGIHAIVEASGLDVSVFREGFQAGQSINAILEANGVEPAAIHAEVLANLEARLAEKVAEGEIDQARADEVLAGASEKLTELMTSVPDGEHRPRPFARFALARALFDSAAETIGITTGDLFREMHESDATIAPVATAHGVDPQVVIDNAVAEALARIDEAEASGTITPERAAEMRENAPERIERFVNEHQPVGHPRP
jgi:hypothetical protein